ALVQVRSTIQSQFKGIDHLVTLYEVGGIAGPYQLALPEKPTASLVSLASPLPVACFPVEGKIVSETAMPGALLRLAGATNADARRAGRVALYTTAKRTRDPLGRPPCPDVYAKVVASESPAPASGGGPQLNGAPSPATAWAEGGQFNGPPSPDA